MKTNLYKGYVSERTPEVLVQFLVGHDVNKCVELLLRYGLPQGIHRVACTGHSRIADRLTEVTAHASQPRHMTIPRGGDLFQEH